MVFLPGQSFAYRYQDALKGHDLTVVGVGVLRQNLSSIDGDEISFEESDEGLPHGYSNRSYLFLNGEGVLYNDIDVTFKTAYDEEDPYEPFKFLINAKRDKDYVILGDHEHGVFQDTVFTSMDNYVRGLTVHGERQRIGATFMAGVLRGETQVDELRGDGTSGPYRLEELPVLEGTETVKIETRDRLNPARILKSVIAVRGKDYHISYDDGEIYFSNPVDEQDFRGNPVFIVISYQFDSPDGRWQRATGGTRLTYSLSDKIQIGATYLTDAPWDESFSSEQWRKRRQIYGSDIVLKLGERYHLNAEIARSEIPQSGSDSSADGLRIRVDTNPIDRLRIFGRYWKVDQGFLTFGNRDLASESFLDDVATDHEFEFRSANLELNLDPNINSTQGTDEEALGISGTYDLYRFRWLSVGYRQSQNNLVDDPDVAIDTERTYFAAVKSVHPEATQWLVGIERNESFDNLDRAENDRVDNRFITALRHPLGSFPWVGPVSAQVAYQFEDTDDLITPEASFQTHDILGRLEVLPLPKLLVYGEQGEQWVYETVLGDFTHRIDTTMLGMEGYINRYFELDASVRLKHDNDLIAIGNDIEESTYTLHWKSHPFKPFKFRLRAEYRISEDLETGQERKKSVLGGQVFWDIYTNFLARAKYSYEVDTVDAPDGIRDETLTDKFNLRLDYRLADQFNCYGVYQIEQDKIMSSPLPETLSRTITVLLGAHYQFNERFDFTAAYRNKTVSNAAEDDRLKYFAELGFQANRFLKVVLGAEHFRYSTDDDQGEYEADVAYFNLVFKL